jgi:hypothetical protein
MGSASSGRVEPCIEIYALCDPATGEIRYIGKANDSEKRLKGHIRDSRRRNTPVYCWIRKLLSSGKFPKMIVLERPRPTEWKDSEARLIAQHKSKRLLNVATGGDEPFCPKEVRAANGRKNAKAIHSDPEKRNKWNLAREVGMLLEDKNINVRIKATLNCMALANLFPDRVPSSWLGIRWNYKDFGDLNEQVIQKYMSERLYSRLDFTGVFA